MRRAAVVRRSTPTSEALAAATPSWEPMSPELAWSTLGPGDVALGRLDVLPTVDGIDDGLWALGALAARGVRVLNGAPALLATHDKLLTARLLRRHGIDHPRTIHVRRGRAHPSLAPPVVVKPRFGSGGRDVCRCDDAPALREALERLAEHPWFDRQGVLVQELVPPQGYDLRILVAGGQLVGSIYRVSAPGEWRTNIALGGTRRAVSELPDPARDLALRAARAAGTALVGVDLMPTADGGWTVIELNGAVEFGPVYRSEGDVFDEVARALERFLRIHDPDDEPVDQPLPLAGTASDRVVVHPDDVLPLQ